MSRTKVGFFVCVLLLCSAVSLIAQQAAIVDSVVPSMVKFTGTLSDINGKPLTGTQGVTFLLYKEETGGAPLWMETQNVQADKNGHYSVMLGSASAHGLPADVFVAGEARWLGVQASGQAEQARTLLLSVPYALKALDAETLGGKPASFFMSASGSKAGATGAGPGQEGPLVEQKNEIVCSSTTTCKTGFVPLFATNGGSSQVTDSIVSQSGTTINLAGSETVNGGIASGGIITATSAASTPTILGTSTGTASGSIGVEGISNSPTSYAVAGSNGSSGIGVYGTSVSGHGVYGSTGATCCFGVVGEGPGGGIYGSGSTGILGFGNSGYGIYGQHVGASRLAAQIPYAGVWGDTNSQVAAGVAGTGQDGVGGIFLNDSPSGYYSLVAASYDSSGPMFTAENISNGVSCKIDPGANLSCSGTYSAVLPLDGGKRKVAVSGIQSPQNWFEDFGSAQLVNGVAVVQLDPDFIQAVNTEKEYNVFLTPYGDCKGLYVARRAANSFEVHELGGGTAGLSFGYRITAIRRNYEKVRFADHTIDPDPAKMLEQMRKHKPASSFNPSLVKPPSLAGRAPVAQLTSK